MAWVVRNIDDKRTFRLYDSETDYWCLLSLELPKMQWYPLPRNYNAATVLQMLGVSQEVTNEVESWLVSSYPKIVEVNKQ
jgi:hypothetical protein